MAQELHVVEGIAPVESNARGPLVNVKIDLGVVPPSAGDAVLLCLGTRWSEREIERFAAEGTIHPLRGAQPDGSVGRLSLPNATPQRVYPLVLEAAKRLRAHGKLAPEWRDAWLSARRVRLAAIRALSPDQLASAGLTPAKVDWEQDQIEALEKCGDLRRTFAAAVADAKSDEERIAARAAYMTGLYRAGRADGAAPKLRMEENAKRARANPLRSEIEAKLAAGTSVSAIVKEYGTRAPKDTVREWQRGLRRTGRLPKWEG